jgi:hypothetical protein
MTYTEQVAESLASTLEKIVSLAEADFAGHVANIDFWLAEVGHVRRLIDEYDERFQRMRKARSEHVASIPRLMTRDGGTFGATPDPGPPLKAGMRRDAANELRRRIATATSAIVARSLSIGLISEDQAVQLRRLGRID